MNGRPATDELVAALAEALRPLVVEVVREELERMGNRSCVEWLTIEQAAEHLHSTPVALRARARRGQLPGAVKDGSRWLVDRQALDDAHAATLPASDNKGSRRRNGRARGTRRS